MPKKIDSVKFYEELERFGGLVGQHFGWRETGELLFYEDTPDHVVAGVKEVYKNHKNISNKTKKGA